VEVFVGNKEACASYQLITTESGAKTKGKRSNGSFERAAPNKVTGNGSMEEASVDRLALLPGVGFSVMFRFLSAAKICRHRMAQFCRKNYGLEPNLFLILSAASEGHLQQGILASTLGINKNAMVFLIDILEARRLIRRVPNPDNRRERFVECTAKGQQIVAATKANYAEIARWGLYPLSEVETDQFKMLLTQIIEGVQTAPCPVVNVHKMKRTTTPRLAVTSLRNGTHG
jgi:DNA-binding MarR family transcriptional regulator